jgi:lipopolysaccharide export system protein LptA
MDRGQDVMILEGHVRLSKGDTILSGQHMKWLRKQRTLEIRGDVLVKNHTSRLSSEHLLYDLGEDAVTAWGRPRLHQFPPQGGGEEVIMRAVQLRLFPKEGRVEAIEDVEVEQSRGLGNERVIEMRVNCRVAEVLARGKRNIFKGDVRVETPDIGARAGRMLYEQESRRVYLLDGARVWNYDSRGRRLDELQGDKVIYFLDEARTIALGGVRASVVPEGKPGQRPLLRTRRSLGE